ncbi:MAG: hypothetical protein PHH63_05590 [Bacteroidales bacterium]|jgi:hypothetical protein|nr:hypothetical protein [Bacteroidales bacterium]MDD3160729.1 hypothetical protein [Bacteroidales bacterium]
MANKRDLKKLITATTDELFLETIVLSHLTNQITGEKTEELLGRIADLRADFLARVNGCGGKDPKIVQDYFRKFKEDFQNQINSIIDEFESLHKKA